MPSALFENLVLHGSKQVVPAFIYGTAWKKEDSANLVYLALCSGFKGFDTAAQPKHYREDLVGDGIRRAVKEGKISRENLFVQTKFTSIQGHDPRNMPYDPKSSITDQVHTSIKSSLHNLRPSEKESSADLTILDSLVFHSPLPTMAQTLEAWKTAETYYPHKIRNLGISNVTPKILEQLYHAVTIKPAVVQNRFHADTGFDAQIRAFCIDKSIIYQSFWTLTANPNIIRSKEVGALAVQAGISTSEAMYCLVLSLGNTTILDGTKTTEHMVGDLNAPRKVYDWASKSPELWNSCVQSFKALIDLRNANANHV